MNDIYESKYHDIRYRAILSKNEVVSVYTQNDSLEICSEFDFDTESDAKNSINYFVSSIAAGFLHSISRIAKKNNIDIEELETKVNVILENPLSYLLVKGYDDEPKIAKISLDIYLYSYEDEELVLNLCKQALEKNILYQSIKNSIEIELRFQLIL